MRVEALLGAGITWLSKPKDIQGPPDGCRVSATGDVRPRARNGTDVGCSWGPEGVDAQGMLTNTSRFQKAGRRMDGADTALALAKAAWEENLLCFIWKSEPFAANDNGAGVTSVVDSVLRVGWTLHSSTHTTKGSNLGGGTEQVMFTFIRT